jgi:hypothetical protein
MVSTMRWMMVLLLAAASGCGGDSNSGVTLGSGGSSGGNGSGGSSGNGSGGFNGGSGGSDSIDAAGTGGSGSGGSDNGGSGGNNGNNGSGGDTPGDAGGSDVPATPGASGLPRASTIESLDEDQRPTLCDWWNMKQGGYGQSADCGGDEPEVTDGDRDECVAGLDDCADATVGDFEDCGNAIGTDLCMFRTAAVCAKLAACF